MIPAAWGAVRAGVRRCAQYLDQLSHGQLRPNTVTIVSLAMHAPIAILIAAGQYYWGAALLIIFGLFDVLDGELARLQGSASTRGMVLDSVADRVKEIMLYAASAYTISTATGQPQLAAWSVVACGCALLASYINAWGDAATARLGVHDHVANKTFRGGLFPFEIRMLVLIVGLISGQLVLAIIIIACGAALTAATRLARVAQQLQRPRA